MKNSMIAMMAALTLAFCRSDMALGQFSSQSGTFGYRVLGQPLAPTQGMFSGGIQTNVAGSFLFLGRPNGGNDFATPWRHPYQSVIDQAIAALPPAQLSLPPQQPVGGRASRASARNADAGRANWFRRLNCPRPDTTLPCLLPSKAPA